MRNLFAKRLLVSVTAAAMLFGTAITANAAQEDLFDAEYYAETYPDVAAAVGNDADALLQHYLNFGITEGRNANAYFNTLAYKTANADLAAAFGDDWDAYADHYVAHGISEGRSAIGEGVVPTQDITTDTTVTTVTEESDTNKISITITATGDCTLGSTQTHGYSGSFHDYYDTYGTKYFFEGVQSIFDADDLTLVNLECVLTNSTDRVEKTWNLKGKPEYVNILTDCSIEACSLGNNHTSDYGAQSLIDTEDVLKEKGIVYGYNEEVGIYETEEGIRIGIVSASLLNSSREQYIKDGIEALKEQQVDLIVACCHWGVEMKYYPTTYQQEAAHRIIDWGADLVIGNHPHVLQGVEVYNGKVICYSLGNFCFGGNKNPSDKDTAIYQQTFTFVDGELQTDEIDAQIIPCRLSSVTSYNNFQPVVFEGDDKQRVIGNMNKYSSAYSSVYFDNDGKLIYSEM